MGGSVEVYSVWPQQTPNGYVYGRVDSETATFWVFPMPGLGYDSAQSLCNKYGGQLATVDRWNEQWDVARGVADIFNLYDDGVFYDSLSIYLWLGYRKPEDSETWTNVQGKQQLPYKGWFADQPSKETRHPHRAVHCRK